MTSRSPARPGARGLLLALAVVAALPRPVASAVAAGVLTRTPTVTRAATPTSATTPTATPTETPAPLGVCRGGVCAYVTPGNQATATALAATLTATAGGGGGSCGFLSIDPTCIIGGILAPIATDVDTMDAFFDNSGVWDSTSPALTTDNTYVNAYANGVCLIAFALMLLFVGGIAWQILFSVLSGHLYAHLLDALWRLLLAAMLSAASVDVIRFSLKVANEAVLGISTIRAADMAAIRAHGGLDDLLTVDVVGLLNAIMELLIGLQAIFRIGLLDFLTIAAPLALLCYGWHVTQDWAQLWTRLFQATVLAQFFQTATLHLADLLWTARLGGSNDVGNILVAFGVLLVVFAIPRILRGQTGSTGALMALAARAYVRRGG